MSSRVLEQNAFTRVQEWNDAGYTGKNSTVWNMEGLTQHGKGTRNRVLHAAPDAKVINRPLNLTVKAGQVTDDKVYDEDLGIYIPTDEFVVKHDIHVVTCSKGGAKSPEGRTKWFKDLRDRNRMVFFNAAGNDGESGILNGTIPEEAGMYIGACLMFAGNPDDIRMAHYSAIGSGNEIVDFSTFTGDDNGTSFASPYLAGITVLMQERYGSMSHQEVYNYLKMISRPINSPVEPDIITEFQGGSYLYDMWSGYGIPILPPLDMHYITMTIGDNFYRKDGEKVSIDTAPFIMGGRTFVPVAFVALALGAEVSWNALLKKVTIRKGSCTIELYIGKTKYRFNHFEYEMDVAPFIRDNRTFVPISFIALALGCRVAWCDSDKKVQILEVDHLEG